MDRRIVVGDEIRVNTPIGSRTWRVARISDCGKWAITEGLDWFKVKVDEKGCTTKKGHKAKNWYVYWEVLRFQNSPVATPD